LYIVCCLYWRLKLTIWRILKFLSISLLEAKFPCYFLANFISLHFSLQVPKFPFAGKFPCKWKHWKGHSYVFWLKENVRIFFTCYDAILECTRHFVPMFSYEKLPCALQDGVIWWRIFTSALVKFRTKYQSDTSGPVSILCLKPVFHSRISPPLVKNFATEKVHLLLFRAVNERSNRSWKF
jgi:hypothetical protein